MRTVVVQSNYLLHPATYTDGQNIVAIAEQVGKLRVTKVVHGPRGQGSITLEAVRLDIPEFIGGAEPHGLFIGVKPCFTDVVQVSEKVLQVLLQTGVPRGVG